MYSRMTACMDEPMHDFMYVCMCVGSYVELGIQLRILSLSCVAVGTDALRDYISEHELQSICLCSIPVKKDPRH